MDPERWRLIRPILESALELRASERVAFLDSVRGLAEEVRADIERMLDEHANGETDFARLELLLQASRGDVA
jgi:hypothetical protein